ncbi:MAG: InlB B-repeat-containing protein [Clostridia bacterium]|nr:InlB B-repeat-containing protein [Clostridia bacterium]
MKKIIAVLMAITVIMSLMMLSFAATGFKVAVTKTGSGTVTGAGTYEEGARVTVEATPKSGYAFSEWTNVSGVTINTTSNKVTFTMPASKVALKAKFVKVATYSLKVNKAGKGKVTGAGKYEENAQVLVTAMADSGYRFAGWTDVTGVNIDVTSSQVTFKMPKNEVKMKANFEKDMSNVLFEVKASGTKGGTVEGSGKFTPGTAVVVKATPDTGYTFDSWTSVKGITVSEVNNPQISFNMPQVKVTLKAKFIKIPTYKVNVTKSGSGEVKGNGNYEAGSTVTINAVPSKGYEFVSFKDIKGIEIYSVNSSELVFNMPANTVSACAVFQKVPDSYVITARADSNGTIEPSGDVKVKRGTDQTFSVTAKSGYVIDKIIVDGNEVANYSGERQGTYTFKNVLEKHQIIVGFKKSDNLIIDINPSNGNLVPGSSIKVSASNMGTAPIEKIYLELRSDNGVLVTKEVKPGTNTAETSIETKDTWLGEIELYGYVNCGQISQKIGGSYNLVSGTVTTYTITAKAGANGTITPSGEIKVAPGAIQTFSYKANDGYTLDKLTVDSKEVSPVAPNSDKSQGGYRFEGVMKNHQISVSFKKNTTEQTVLYGDVDGNGKVDEDDIIAFSNYINNKVALANAKAADVFSDGKTDVMDLVTLKYSLRSGKNTILPHLCIGSTKSGYYKGLIRYSDENHIIVYTCNCGEINYQETEAHKYSSGKCACGEVKKIYGDVNMDGVVNSSDLTWLESFLNNEIGFTDIQMKYGDVDNNGYIDLTDYYLLKLALTNTSVKLPHTCKYVIINVKPVDANEHQLDFKCECGKLDKFTLKEGHFIQNEICTKCGYGKQEIATYTITFNSNGGTGTMSNQTFRSGVAQVLSNNQFTRSGYSFVGWATTKTNANNGTVRYVDGEKLSISSDMTLYAVWEEIVAVNPPTVTVTPDGGTIDPEANVKINVSAYNKVNVASLSYSWNNGTVKTIDGKNTASFTQSTYAPRDEGKATLKITAKNVNGEETSVTKTFTIKAKTNDKTPPSITVSPESGSIVETGASIKIIAKDTGHLKALSYQMSGSNLVNVNIGANLTGKTVTVKIGNTIGSYTLTIKATDVCGNETTLVAKYTAKKELTDLGSATIEEPIPVPTDPTKPSLEVMSTGDNTTLIDSYYQTYNNGSTVVTPSDSLTVLRNLTQAQ